jgi:hypothetical protein
MFTKAIYRVKDNVEKYLTKKPRTIIPNKMNGMSANYFLEG